MDRKQTHTQRNRLIDRVINGLIDECMYTFKESYGDGQLFIKIVKHMNGGYGGGCHNADLLEMD